MEIITYEIPQTVMVRKFSVDCNLLCETLRRYKKESEMSNKQISDKLCIPITKVEHWFRQDDCFAIPDEEIWMRLKELLGIQTDEFDESIMTFEEKENVFEKGNRIYDSMGICPTITCADATTILYRSERMEVKQIGNLWGEDTDFENKTSGRVYDKYGISPTLNTMQGGWKQPMVIEEPKCLNSKGGRKGVDGLQPSLQDRVYSTEGVSVAVTTSFMPSFLEEKQIVAMRGRNPDNPSDRTVGSPTEQRLEPNSQGICNTLTSVQKDNMVMESKIIKVGQISSEGSEYGTVISENGISSNLVAGTHGYANNCIATNYRIRKLTPRCCWRLMDFTDEDFEKAAAVNSQTQLYKQAGNSIVVNVLVAILGQMIPGKEDVYKKRCS